MNKKPKKKSRYKLLQEKINANSKYIDIPKNITKLIPSNIDMHTNLLSNIIYSKNKIIKKTFELKSDILKNEPIKTTKYELLPTNKQQIILQKWFNAYIDMYNLIIKKIKNAVRLQLETNKKFKLIDLEIDLNIAKLKKEFAYEKEKLRDKYSINMHILDYAINDAVSMHKSKMSNLKNGHIKYFRLRYLKRTKSQKIIKIENHLCKEHTFCERIIGSQITTTIPINFKELIKIVGIIHYNQKTNKYNLFVRERIMNETPDKIDKYNKELNLNEQIESTTNEYLTFMKNNKYRNANNDDIKKLSKRIDINKRKLNNTRIYENKLNYRRKQSSNTKIVGIDPGIRTFLTGISDDHIFEIGTNMNQKLKQKIKFIDKITNSNQLTEDKKRKLIERTELKIRNKMNDYHWKIINYLISNYKHIIIGNFSTKRMCETDIDKLLKRIGKKLRLYVFKQRLQYKCYLNGIKYTEIDEYCTSKCCSTCGYFKKNLGSNKVYECDKCKFIVDRDINAAKNILMKCIK